ncbi:exodeoxyribonuclease III, partial [Candidatus Omnitrophota bacterium]
MRIFSWNVNGIRSVAGKGFSEWFSKESPDILCLQETKAHPEQIEQSHVIPEGYLAYWNNPERKGYAGVSVFSKDKPVTVKKDFPPASFNTEGRTLILEFKDFILINVYFPNGGMGPIR